MKIIINPGHSLNGCPDPGACANDHRESDITAEISYFIKVFLDSEKYSNLNVDIMQQSDTINSNAQLNALIKNINKAKADLLVSVHLNSATNTSAHGSETLYFAESSKGKVLATKVQKEMGSITQIFNRGIKQDTRGLAVLKRTNMPACLVEVGFISNKSDINNILKYKLNIAKAISCGIINYLKDQKLLIEKHSDTSENTELSNIRLPRIELIPENNKYNCYIDGEIKLKNNKLSTCLNWLKGQSYVL